MENPRNRTCLSDSVPDDSVKTRRGLISTFRSYARDISKRLQELGKGRISRGMDAEVLPNVSRTDKIEHMSTQTREDDFASSIFEWVKSEKQGDICRFREFAIVNGEEYVVFNDDSRVKSMLLGDVVLKHQHESQILGREMAAQPKATNPDEPFEFPVDSDLMTKAQQAPKRVNYVNDTRQYVPPPVAKVDSPIMAILEKSKKRKQKVVLEIQMEVPSAEVLSIVRENFSGSEEELYNFFISKMDKKKFVSAIILAVQNK